MLRLEHGPEGKCSLGKAHGMKKLRIGILFGGRSGEHEVSLLSAASVLEAIDRKKYEVVPIGITKEGHWVTGEAAEQLLHSKGAKSGKLAQLVKANAVVLSPTPDKRGQARLIPIERASGAGASLSLDVIFPVLHGTFGEDGTMQGLFDLAGVAYVGSGVLGSATGMDKDIMKRLFASASLPLTRHLTFLRPDWEKSPRKVVAQIEANLPYPLFVKPANLGSSVGISKAHDRKELKAAIELAAGYDRKILVEQGVGGKQGKAREFEVAVLGNDHPEASVVGEIVPGKEFYDYEDKYLIAGSVPIIPAALSKAESTQVREMAIAAFRACDCAGLGRVDFLREPGAKGRIYVNEINTMPGFTAISMYPKMWEASGLPYPALIDRLIELARERWAEQQRNRYSR